MSDLQAIREDIAMAERSPEMAKHVALDHAPELVDEVEKLRAEVKRLEGEIQVIADFAGVAADARDIVRQMRSRRVEVVDLKAEVKRLTPSEITTVEELEALPNGSVIRSDEGCIWEKDISGWYEPGSRHGCVASDLAIPATVRYLPEGGDQ